jgi:hypothetical protein
VIVKVLPDPEVVIPDAPTTVRVPEEGVALPLLPSKIVAAEVVIEMVLPEADVVTPDDPLIVRTPPDGVALPLFPS